MYWPDPCVVDRAEQLREKTGGKVNEETTHSDGD
jgi:hypothetical protein